MRRPCAIVLALLLPCAALVVAQKLTPERLLELHRQALTAGAELPPDQTREVRGACATTTPARAAGQLTGTFRLSSSPRSGRFVLQFKSDLYEGEAFTVDGDQVDIGFAQPRTGSRSAMGNFVARHRAIVAEGLFGGVLNGRWPLLQASARQAKLGYDGIKKFAGRDLHRIRYRAKEKQGDLEIHLYFEPETYRHVASVYSTTQAQGLGATMESSSQQADSHFRLEERFSDFQRVGALTLPKTWTVRYERTGNTANEWKYDLTVESVDEAQPPKPRSGPPSFLRPADAS